MNKTGMCQGNSKAIKHPEGYVDWESFAKYKKNAGGSTGSRIFIDHISNSRFPRYGVKEIDFFFHSGKKNSLVMGSKIGMSYYGRGPDAEEEGRCVPVNGKYVMLEETIEINRHDRLWLDSKGLVISARTEKGAVSSNRSIVARL
jgi:hypothetical protein